MKTLFILTILTISCFVLQAQARQSDKTVTHFFTVNIDQDLLEVYDSTKSANHSIPPQEEFVSGIIDTFYSMASGKFKNELGLDLLPLSELQGKVKYNNLHPKCPDMTNIKKVLKNASGYKYYADYFINIFTDFNTDIPVVPSPTRIRPLYAISFTIYDETGKEIKKINLCYKSKKSLAETKQDMNNLGEQMKSKLCSFYSEALSELTLAYKKENKNRETAQL